jgi:hypothetical protein
MVIGVDEAHSKAVERIRKQFTIASWKFKPYIEMYVAEMEKQGYKLVHHEDEMTKKMMAMAGQSI